MSMSKKLKILSAIFLLAAMVPFFCLAQVENLDANLNKVGLSVDQTVFSFNLDPGASQDFKIKVKNISEKPENLSAEGEDFSVADNNEVSFLAGDNELYGIKNWLKINESNWNLDPGQEKEINISISIPKDATVGSHYSVVSIRAYPQISGDNFQSTIVSGRIGIYVLVNVLGDVSGKGAIKNFQVPIISGNNVALDTEFENTGNIHYIPHGEIHIKNLLTRRDNSIDLEKHFVFPGKKYNFETTWNSGSIFGVYRAQASFVDGDGRVHLAERFIFGKLFFLIPFVIILSAIALFKIRKKKVAL